MDIPHHPDFRAVNHTYLERKPSPAEEVSATPYIIIIAFLLFVLFGRQAPMEYPKPNTQPNAAAATVQR